MGLGSFENWFVAALLIDNKGASIIINFYEGNWVFADFSSQFMWFLVTAGVAFCPMFQAVSVPTFV